MTHVGISVPSTGRPDAATAARAVEAAGLDGVWTGDHLAWSGPFLDSTAQLAAAAAVTERITLGWGVMLPALRPAAWAAKHVASVQHLSRGRVQLGVGIGPAGPEWRAAGTSATGRAARTDAFLAALPGLLAGRPTLIDGAEVTLEPAVAVPPLWIGGASDAALARAVRTGAGWLSAMLPPDALAARARDLAGLAEPGPPPRVGTLVFAAAGQDTADPVVDMLAGGYGLPRETAEAAAIAGGPDRLAEGLAAHRDAGADTLVVHPVGPGPLDAIDLLGEARTLLGS